LQHLGPEIFLDLKFHDISKHVAAVRHRRGGLAWGPPADVHTLGGLEMMRAAAKARDESALPKTQRPNCWLTILTSMDNASLRAVGISGTHRLGERPNRPNLGSDAGDTIRNLPQRANGGTS